MKGNRYTLAFNKLLNKLDSICIQYNKSKGYFLWDAAWAYICYGVTPNQYIGFAFYRLSALERKQFYTARFQNKYDKRFNPPSITPIFNDKEKTLKTFARYVQRDWLYTPNATVEEVSRFLDRHPKVIVKPSNLSSGRGIYVRKNETAEEIKGSGCLLEEFVCQHHDMSKLNSSSVNTIRIYTLIKKQLSSPSLPPPIWITAMVRVGGAGAEVDNYHQGGVGYPIDIETGIISACGYDINGKSYLFHPGTDTQAIGFQIPNWNKLKEYVNNLCSVVPEARLIAWDIVVLEDGFDLIEANVNGDSGLMQSVSKEGKRRMIMNEL